MLLPVLCCGPSPALQRSLRFPGWESPGDVVRTSETEWSVGGKATNAARAVNRAGGQATLLGPAGGMNGARMRALLAGEEIDALWVEVETETRICQTLLDEKGHRIRELVEDAGELTPGEWAELFAHVERALPFHSALLLCGSLPAGAPEGVYAGLVELAREARRKVVMDVRGAPLRAALPWKPDLVKINAGELQQTTGETEIPNGMRALKDLGAGEVFITDGPRCAWLSEGRRIWRFDLPEIEAVNPIGGGDTVTGVTALGWIGGAGLKEAAIEGLGAGLAQTLRPRPADFEVSQARALARNIRVHRNRGN